MQQLRVPLRMAFDVLFLMPFIELFYGCYLFLHIRFPAGKWGSEKQSSRKREKKRTTKTVDIQIQRIKIIQLVQHYFNID